MPNVIHYDDEIPNNDFDNVFGFDSCRYALWAGAFLQINPNYGISTIKRVLEILLTSLLTNSQINKNFIKNNTLPSKGIDVLTNTPIGTWNSPTIPLNATVMTGAAILGGNYQKIFDALSPDVLSYRIEDHKPSINDPIGDSSPYYSAAMVLMSEAILNQKPPFKPASLNRK